jgi:hypothetical protein
MTLSGSCNINVGVVWRCVEQREVASRSRLGSTASRSGSIAAAAAATNMAALGAPSAMVVENVPAGEWIEPQGRDAQGSMGGSIGQLQQRQNRKGSIASRGELKARQCGLQIAVGVTPATAVHIKASGINNDMQEYRLLLAGQESNDRRARNDPTRR